MIALERGAQARAAAMEQDPLVRLGDLERRAHFFGGPTFDVAQDDDGRLRRRERRDLALQENARLLSQGQRFGRFVPRGRRRGPIAARAETLGLVIVVASFERSERREWHGALVTPPRVLARFTRIPPIHVR